MLVLPIGVEPGSHPKQYIYSDEHAEFASQTHGLPTSSPSSPLEAGVSPLRVNVGSPGHRPG